MGRSDGTKVGPSDDKVCKFVGKVDSVEGIELVGVVDASFEGCSKVGVTTGAWVGALVKPENVGITTDGAWVGISVGRELGTYLV